MPDVQKIRIGVVLLAILPAFVVATAALSGNGHRAIDIWAQFVGPVVAWTLVVTLVLVAVRLWRLAGVALIALMLLAMAGTPQWFPPVGKAQADRPIIRVYSANMWARNKDVNAMARSIAAADADILMLVEVGDVPAAQADRLLAGYPHRHFQTRRDRPSGAAREVIASRYPLKPVTDPADGLSAITARAQTPMGPVTVMAVHLTRPWPFKVQWGQLTQAERIASRRATITGPIIVAGDFNSVSGARVGRQVQADTGLIPASGWPATWPSAAPSAIGMTIDQVYRSPDLALVARRLGRPTGSDHRPVITEFTLATPAR